jgi:hypothetical protein
MTGGSNNCYTLTIVTNIRTESTPVNDGSAIIDMGAFSYSDDTDVFFRVEKTCALPVREQASFTAAFHL